MDIGIKIYRRDQGVAVFMTKIAALIRRTWWIPFKERIIQRLAQEVLCGDS